MMELAEFVKQAVELINWVALTVQINLAMVPTTHWALNLAPVEAGLVLTKVRVVALVVNPTMAIRLAEEVVV